MVELSKQSFLRSILENLCVSVLFKACAEADPTLKTGHRRWFGRCYSRSRRLLQVDYFDDTRHLHTHTRREGRGRRGNEEFLDSIRRFYHGFSPFIKGEC